MHLYLIRHGETVDNVAGLYAGVRDSALTNHGVEQTQRLGNYFKEHNVQFTHIFASPLSRAFKTAQAVQKPRDASLRHTLTSETVEIQKVPDLVERDYGSYEGKSYSTRSEWESKPDFVNVESTQSLARRGDAFLDQHLLPLFEVEAKYGECVVAVVAHGMLLSHLWRRLLLRLPRRTLTVAPEIIAARGNLELEKIGSWSNTGFLELSIRKDSEAGQSSAPVESTAAAEAATLVTPVTPPLQSEGANVSVAPPRPGEIGAVGSSRTLFGYSTTILKINNQSHLVGLKRQAGGIGSMAHDGGQKKLESFFKPKS